MSELNLLQLAIQFLTLKTTAEQYVFIIKIKTNLQPRHLHIFIKWIDDVNGHESHATSKKEAFFYINRFMYWMSK